MKGLCGCTGLFIASEKGAFTAHMWEKDTKTKGALREKNYKGTLKTMKEKLSPHKNDLKGGVAYIMRPGKYQGEDVYLEKISDAIKDAVKDASGLEPTVVTYTPLSSGNPGNQLGENQRGTGATLYDPKYKNPKEKDAKEQRAFRIYIENKLQKEMKWSSDSSGSGGPGPSTVAPMIPPSQPTCNATPNKHYQDAHREMVLAASRAFCKQDANKVVHDKQVRIGESERPGSTPGDDAADDHYLFKIKSVDGCPAPHGYDLREPVKGYSCENVTFTAWNHCYNDGRGGAITAGCLTYGIHPRN